ncbi:hypothetical protein HDU67_004631 [Dinochytrium kinnereticum]|nr:hypothetical protein HDU67_004631 [Dinochytrium kinnereticum]
MPRVTLIPLPSYVHSYLRQVERSNAPASHFDNVAMVEFISDAQQRFFDFLFVRAKDAGMENSDVFETVNGDLQVAYLDSQPQPPNPAQTHKFDTLRIHVGVQSIARVAFRLSFHITRERTAEENRIDLHRLSSTALPPITSSPKISAALAEIGVVQVDHEGRPCELSGGLRRALMEVLEEQERANGEPKAHQ